MAPLRTATNSLQKTAISSHGAVDKPTRSILALGSFGTGAITEPGDPCWCHCAGCFSQSLPTLGASYDISTVAGTTDVLKCLGTNYDVNERDQ